MLFQPRRYVYRTAEDRKVELLGRPDTPGKTNASMDAHPLARFKGLVLR